MNTSSRNYYAGPGKSTQGWKEGNGIKLEEFGETISSLQAKAGFMYISRSPKFRGSLCTFRLKTVVFLIWNILEKQYWKGLCLFKKRVV